MRIRQTSSRYKLVKLEYLATPSGKAGRKRVNANPLRKSKRKQYKAYRRGASRATPIIATDLDALFDAQSGLCGYCFVLLVRGTFQCHEDHKIPLSRGGSHEISNIQFLCQPCNDGKGSRTDEECRSIKFATNAD